MSSIALVFPGQGSQSVGMLQELAQQYPVVQHTFSEASDTLGYDLWQKVQTDSDGDLNATQVTQPALLTASVAVWRVLQSQCALSSIQFMAGHSLGEYSALVCAEAISFTDAVALVEKRGKFMQQAVPAGEGAMFAILGLDDQQIIDICHHAAIATGNVVSAVNFNSIGQVVIAGEKSAAQHAADMCKQAGAKRALPLAVSVPSHCELMRPAAEQLEETLSRISIVSPSVPVVNNVDVEIANDPSDIKDALVRQLYCPVRWTETVSWLATQGVSHIVEVGPGKVLSGLNKRIAPNADVFSVNAPESVAQFFSVFSQ